MSLRLSGYNPLAYLGNEPLQIAADFINNRDPNANDSKNFTLMTRWLNKEDQTIWVLTSLSGGIATWIQLTGTGGGIIQINTDAGNIVPVAGIINLNGLHGINTAGAGNNGTVAINNAITLGDLAPLAANSGALTATTGDIIISAGDLTLPDTNAAGNQGIIKFGGNRWISNFGTSNTFVGEDSGNTTLTAISAISNTAVGAGALSSLTTGSDNTAIGNIALEDNTTGSSNTALGSSALHSNTTGSRNTALGTSVLADNTVGDDSTAVGYQALSNNTNGDRNTAYGSSALEENTDGSDGSAFGYQALGDNTLGNQNSAFGSQSLAANIDGDNNSAFGFRALFQNLNGDNNTSVGFQSLNLNTASNNTAVGSNALATNSTGTRNTAVGTGALLSSGVANDNTAVGYNALTLATGSSNVAIGSMALDSLTTGTQNIAIGLNAGQTLTATGNNVIIGVGAMQFANGASNNTIVGTQAATQITTGSENVAIGTGTLTNITTGNNNVCVGRQSGIEFTLADSNNITIGRDTVGQVGEVGFIWIGAQDNAAETTGNIFIGYNAGNDTYALAAVANVGVGLECLTDLTTGTDNTALGNAALGTLTTGSGNTGIGSNALGGITTGTDNIALGNGAGEDLTIDDSSNILIGHVGIVGDVNTIRIGTDGNGDGEQDTCFIAGIAGVAVANLNLVTIDTVTGQLGSEASGGMTSTFATDNGNAVPAAGTITFTATAVGGTFEFDGAASTVSLTSTDADDNMGVGEESLDSIVAGAARNTAVGFQSLFDITTGTDNIALGEGSGSALTLDDSSNIIIGNDGVVGDNNTIRIGVDGSGDSEQDTCFIAGIIGNTVANAEVVTIDSVTGQLGVRAGGGGDIAVVNTQVFTANGTYTPTAGMVYCIVEVVGGGGGGGATTTPPGATVSMGGGGGGGGYARKTFDAATIGASKAVTIGAAGAAGVAPAGNGGNGGTTSLGVLITATGGLGGRGDDTQAVGLGVGGAGGSGTLGDFNTSGTPGDFGFGVAGGADNGWGGNGGSTFFGGGAVGNEVALGASAPGNNATSYGGGGSGAATGTGAGPVGVNGGTGFAGIVVITEYIT